MVALLLAPLAVGVVLYAVDAALPMDLVIVMNGSLIFTAVLSVVLLAAVLAAAWRNRENAVLMSAWLFLFCGLTILSIASLIDPFFPGADSWTEELVSTASFFPLLFFAVYIASPLRLMLVTQRRRLLSVAGGVVALLAVFAVVFVPWLLLYEGPRLHSTTKHLLHLAKPVLDTLLVEPIALMVLAMGFTRGGRPYVLTGLGLVLLIPEDILEHFQLLQQMDPHGQISILVSVVSRLYLLTGALLAVARPREEKAAD